MPQLHRIRPASWLIAVLVSLVGLGHACELPRLLDRVAHAGEPAHHHDTGHHTDEARISCDAVDAASTARTHAGAALDSQGRVDSTAASAPIWRADVLPQGSIGVSARPPLFLLHGSLLI